MCHKGIIRMETRAEKAVHLQSSLGERKREERGRQPASGAKFQTGLIAVTPASYVSPTCHPCRSRDCTASEFLSSHSTVAHCRPQHEENPPRGGWVCFSTPEGCTFMKSHVRGAAQQLGAHGKVGDCCSWTGFPFWIIWRCRPAALFPPH